SRDCLDQAANLLRERGISQAEIDAIKQAVNVDIERIVDEASQQPYGDQDHALGGVYA
ncbi:MAG: hypothetical protein HON70_34145, partial [Lentisphaerae bacterium]|nr:hypothetical protein [Lentisphaerota bacterium]